MKRLMPLVLCAAIAALLFTSPVLAQATEGQQSRSLITALLSWLPLLVLVALWFLFGKLLKRTTAVQERSMAHMDRVEELLERIAETTENNRA